MEFFFEMMVKNLSYYWKYKSNTLNILENFFKKSDEKKITFLYNPITEK